MPETMEGTNGVESDSMVKSFECPNCGAGVHTSPAPPFIGNCGFCGTTSTFVDEAAPPPRAPAPPYQPGYSPVDSSTSAAPNDEWGAMNWIILTLAAVIAITALFLILK